MPCLEPSSTYAGGESVDEVAARLHMLIERVERQHQGMEIVLVAHGDTLSILWAYMRGRPLSKHREIALQTGELRALYSMNSP